MTMSTHLPYSGLPVPSMIPGISLNWRRTSKTIAWAATPTAFIRNEVKKNGRIAPMIRPATTSGLSIVEESGELRPRAAPAPLLRGGERVGREQGERGEDRRADRVALRDRLGRVADGVERVRDPRASGGSFAISAIPPALSVIGPERVDRDDHPRDGEHARRGEARSRRGPRRGSAIVAHSCQPTAR